MPTPPGIIESRLFTRIWSHLGLTAADLIAMQNECFLRLKSAPVISGCGGARKMRFSPVSSNSGKSGAVRVIFKYFEDFGLVLMLIVYPKNVKANISIEDKRAFVGLIAEFESELEKRFRRVN